MSARGRELTRISLVDQSLEIVYDSLVKPECPIIDYLTRYIIQYYSPSKIAGPDWFFLWYMASINTAITT